MGHKVSPIALRIGINQDFRSQWYFNKNKQIFLEADYLIRKIIKDLFPKAGIIEILIERKSFDVCKVYIKTAKPGLLIGKEGLALKKLITKLEKTINPIFMNKNLVPPKIDVDILEFKKPYKSAEYLVEIAASEIEKGVTVRKVLKRLIERVKQEKDVEGIKIKASGRLDGATIKRRETLVYGRMPLSQLKAKIDYAQRPVLTKYGYVTLKIWLYLKNGT